MNTKPIKTMKINDKKLPNIVQQVRKSKIEYQLEAIQTAIDSMVKKIESLVKKQKGWIPIKNKDVFYNHDVCGLFPNLKEFELGYCSTYYHYEAKTFQNKFEKYTGALMSIEEFQKAFAGKSTFLNQTFGFQTYDYYTISPLEYFVDLNSTNGYHWNNQFNCHSYHIPIYRLQNEVESMTATESVYALLKEGLVPVDFDQQMEERFLYLCNLYKKDKKCFLIQKGKLICKQENFIHLVENKGVAPMNSNTSLKLDDISKDLKGALPVEMNHEEIMGTLTQTFLNCDTERADIDPYDKKILTDPNRGHWDLWDLEEPHESDLLIHFETPLLGRDPISDVNFDGVIGIDFGTKSTVVVFQKQSEHTMPMRIGTGRLSKEIEVSHYENPTILEFIDYESFFEAYMGKSGRPDTLWEQVTTSHTAFDSFINSNSENYYSYLYELKQWAGDKKKKIRLRDKQGKDVVLSPYLDIGEGEFDPIEIYAYYIGLYINNMHSGIYLDYLLSYPIAYEKSVRDKMIASFTRGIQKSFPTALLNQSEVMDKFRVTVGASEPVAYAICALEEYGFHPVDEEKVFYGVFDFGGGTTDFDFGLYREASNEERRYDYVAQSFGAGGDQYLGGENLLELLAFEVFKANHEILRQQNITFILPAECKMFLGCEMLLSESQEAKLNMAQLMEKLRFFWEKLEGYESMFDDGILKVNLFDVTGQQLLNFELAIDPAQLDMILRERIEKGVRNFFQGLIEAFKLSKNTNSIDKIHILLAGNASKSVILREIFDEYIEKYNKIILKTLKDTTQETFFQIFPSLGTEEAREIQKSLNLPEREESIECPTGKTGVAFGLIKSRYGGRIKLATEKKMDEEIKFIYYIGYEKKQKFKVLTDREIEYDKWYDFIDATEIDFTIFYSKLPESRGGKLDVKEVSRKKCRLDKTYANGMVYFRAVSPTVIEYVVADVESIQKNEYLSHVVRLELDE